MTPNSAFGVHAAPAPNKVNRAASRGSSRRQLDGYADALARPDTGLEGLLKILHKRTELFLVPLLHSRQRPLQQVQPGREGMTDPLGVLGGW